MTQPKPASPDAIRTRIQYYAGQNVQEFDNRKWGAMIGWLNKYLLTDDLRHLVLGWLFAFENEKFEPLHSKDLTSAMKYAISKWIGSWHNEDTGEWETRSTFPQECLSVLNAARYDYYELCGQFTMDLPFEVNGQPAGVVSGVIEDPLWNDELLPPDGAEWCRWCGDVVAAPGEPCAACKALGAEKEPETLPEPPRRSVALI